MLLALSHAGQNIMKSDVHKDWRPLKTSATTNRPAHGVYVWLLVEVVAVLADVVQLGVERGVVLAPARPPVSLTEMSIRVIRIIPNKL